MRPTYLHPMWRYGLALAWAAALVGLLVPENQGYDLGKRPFWWDGVLLVVAAVGAVVVVGAEGLAVGAPGVHRPQRGVWARWPCPTWPRTRASRSSS